MPLSNCITFIATRLKLFREDIHAIVDAGEVLGAVFQHLNEVYTGPTAVRACTCISKVTIGDGAGGSVDTWRFTC